MSHFNPRDFLRPHPSPFPHFLNGPILALCRILLFSDVLVEVFSLPRKRIAIARPSHSPSSACETKPICASVNSRTAPVSKKPPIPSVFGSTAALACDAAYSTGDLNRHSICAKGSPTASRARVQMQRVHPARCAHVVHLHVQNHSS